MWGKRPSVKCGGNFESSGQGTSDAIQLRRGRMLAVNVQSEEAKVATMETTKISRRQKTCLFCGNLLQPKKNAQNAKSDEHVIPEWLQNYLGITGNPVTPTVFDVHNQYIVDRRRHVMGAFKAGTVCYDCNHGWMSALEEEAKPILMRLIEDPPLLRTLAEPERLTVGRWALKTPAVLNRCSSYGKPSDGLYRSVPDDHMRLVASGRLPDNVLVVGSRYQSHKAFDFLQFIHWIYPLRVEDSYGSYKIALSFRDLVLIVVYFPSDDYAYVINRDYHIPLWAGSRLVHFDDLMDDSPSQSSSPQLEALMRNISVVRHRRPVLAEIMGC